MPEPGWVRDPSGRYHQRYFDGTMWTEHVADEFGRRGVDPVDAIQRAVQQPAPPGALVPVGVTPPRPSSASVGPAGIAISPRLLVGVGGAVITVIAVALLPWYRDTRIAQMGAAPVLGGPSVVKISYFETGWIVTLVAVFAAGAAALSSAVRPVWVASVPVAVCAAWAALSTILLKGDFDGVSYSYGFFVAVVGLVATAMAPWLPGPVNSSSAPR